MKTAFRCKKIFFILASLLFCGTVFSAESNSSPMKVRVGFFQFEGYHQIAADGTKYGYGYDFLQMIAPYANFEYEYIGYDKSWSEMQKMLENGEIDLLTSAQKTPAREDIFDFSDRCIGFSSTIITTTPSNTKISTSDFSTFQNIRVGMLKNNSRNKNFENYAKRHEFEYNPVYFENQILMSKALKENKIDVMVSSDLRILNNEIILAKFDDSPFFAIVKKGNKELIGRVNEAIEDLSMDSPNWMHSLSYKHYSNTHHGNEIVLLPKEVEFLSSLKKNNKKLKVLINPDRAPYTSFEHGVYQGIFVELLENIAKKIDLKYEFIECKTVKDYENMIRSGVADIVFGCVLSNYTAESLGYHLTNSFHTMALACVTRVGEVDVQNRVAVNEGMAFLNKRYKLIYGDRDQIKCSTIKECMKAVQEKRADCTYVYTYTASKYVFEDVKGSLAYAPVNNTPTNVSIGVHDKMGPVLFHLMNRIASNLTEDEVQVIIANYTHFDYSENFFLYMIYRQPWIFTSVVVAILCAIFIFIGIKRNREKEIALFLVKEGKEKRDALELAYEAAEKANKAKSDFLSKMSHDIRTPMNAIVGMTAIAQNHVNDPARMTECLSKITSSSNHLLELINEVLDMSKIESGTFSLSYAEFDIQKLVDEAVEIVLPEIKSHKHNIFVDTDKIQHKNVVGDPVRIKQVFVNIVGNSIKYTPNGGDIEISVREIENNQQKIGAYEFVFKDNGIGMSAEFLQKIFDPFSREQDSRVDKIQGTGLGLAITKSIIEMMDGTIAVQSEQNEGTTFTIVLKMKYQDSDIESDAQSIEKIPVSLMDFNLLDFSGKRVLLVDDNSTNREIAREILSMTKIQVDEAENGRIAVEKFEKSPLKYYDIIFMDVQMPVMNGYDASLAIRALMRDDAASIPIIAMTADAFTEDIEKAVRSGMNEHLAKPLDMKKLAAVLQKWL